MNLRDHDERCEHGLFVGHLLSPRVSALDWCPGGAEVIVDYEAATNVAIGRSGDPWEHLHPVYVRALRNRMEKVRLVVDAALGIVEEDA